MLCFHHLQNNLIGKKEFQPLMIVLLYSICAILSLVFLPEIHGPFGSLQKVFQILSLNIKYNVEENRLQ